MNDWGLPNANTNFRRYDPQLLQYKMIPETALRCARKTWFEPFHTQVRSVCGKWADVFEARYDDKVVIAVFEMINVGECVELFDALGQEAMTVQYDGMIHGYVRPHSGRERFLILCNRYPPDWKKCSFTLRLFSMEYERTLPLECMNTYRMRNIIRNFYVTSFCSVHLSIIRCFSFIPTPSCKRVPPLMCRPSPLPPFRSHPLLWGRGISLPMPVPP